MSALWSRVVSRVIAVDSASGPLRPKPAAPDDAVMKKQRALPMFWKRPSSLLTAVSGSDQPQLSGGRINARPQRMTQILPRSRYATTRKWWAVKDSNLGPAD